MRDGGAAARADVPLAAASGGMQAAHLLHGRGVPDLRERLLPDGAQRLAVQHVALAAGVHVAVLFYVHRPAGWATAGGMGLSSSSLMRNSSTPGMPFQKPRKSSTSPALPCMRTICTTTWSLEPRSCFIRAKRTKLSRTFSNFAPLR